MDSLTVTSWTRYGHDRLHVQTADGTRLGYWNTRQTGWSWEPGADEQTVQAALAQHGAAVTNPRAAPSPAKPPHAEPAAADVLTALEAPKAPAAAPEAAADRDLADVRAGAAAREQALALEQAAPVKTFRVAGSNAQLHQVQLRSTAEAPRLAALRVGALVRVCGAYRVDLTEGDA